ncbi:MAG: universal stress protein [Bacteroidetes bacterium]|nr:universal stress protein [Bacteroidota bacterium]
MDSIKTPKDNIILVPTDFSTASNNAIEHAVNIADLFDNEITLLYVVEESFFSSLFGGGMEKSVLVANINKQLEEKAAEITSKYPKIKVNTLMREGKPYKQIVEAAESLACDSIVMGYNGDHMAEQIIGSTTSRVLKSAHVPVVIVKDIKSTPNYKKIVLPIDLTKESRQKVSWAIHLANKYDSQIHIIMEVENDEFLQKKVQGSLNQVEHILRKNNVNFVSKLLDDQEYPDHFGKDIIKYSEEIDADLIMIMTQKEGGVMDFFLGSFAQQIIHGTKRTPIMAINPKETAKSYWATESFS